MPLLLTDPLVTSIYSYQIKKIDINLVNNEHQITIGNRDIEGNEISEQTLQLPIFDDFGNVIVPSTWPEENPTGEQMYALIKQFIFLGLQDQPGENGLGPGTIT